MHNFISRNLKTILVLCALLFVFDAYGTYAFFKPHIGSTDIYFLDVGQGDGELIVFPSGGKILIDAGPANGHAARELGSIISPWDRVIDLAIFTHPEEDHFGGIFDLYHRIPTSAILSSGIGKESDGFKKFQEIIAEKNIKEITVAKGDVIRHGTASMKIMWPEKNMERQSAINDAGIVMMFETEGIRTIFTGDISESVEKKLMDSIGDVDILKVSHHGSKYSSTNEFLRVLRPELAFIEVGKNSYGHPTKEVLERITAVGSRIFRTDMEGTMRVGLYDGKADVYAFR